MTTKDKSEEQAHHIVLYHLLGFTLFCLALNFVVT